MPYPEDPFALKLKTVFECPTCHARPLIQETKDQQSKFMGQVRCESCGFVSDVGTIRKAWLEAKRS